MFYLTIREFQSFYMAIHDDSGNILSRVHFPCSKTGILRQKIEHNFEEL
jgi:hypothetical protein